MRFPAKITLSCIWVADLLIELFYIGVPVVQTDGRAYGHVITKFSRMGRLPHFLIYGAPLRALRARQLGLLKFSDDRRRNMLENV